MWLSAKASHKDRPALRVPDSFFPEGALPMWFERMCQREAGWWSGACQQSQAWWCGVPSLKWTLQYFWNVKHELWETPHLAVPSKATNTVKWGLSSTGYYYLHATLIPWLWKIEPNSISSFFLQETLRKTDKASIAAWSVCCSFLKSSVIRKWKMMSSEFKLQRWEIY